MSSETIGELFVIICGVLGGIYGLSKGYPKGREIYQKLKGEDEGRDDNGGG